MKELKVPGYGRVGVSNPFYHEKAGQGSGIIVNAGSRPQGYLTMQVVDKNGRVKSAKEVMGMWGRFWGNIKSSDTVIDTGSGLVTNVGVTALANDWNWAQNVQTIKLANYHATGTGATAAAATDIALQTADSVSPVAGTQSLVSAPNSQKYQTVATLTYAGTEAVTEWGLFTDNVLSVTTGTPATATSATSLTGTATPYTASSTTVRGQQQHIVKTGTTTVYGLILSNTTSVLTIPAWYTVAGGTAGSTPGATEAFTILPVMWDHKVFSAVNVNSGDSIQFTYTITINSGG